MAWDDNKDAGDLIRSSEWDTMVSDQKGHSSEHEDAGRDPINLLNISDFTSHASRHEGSGSDSINHDLLLNYVADEHVDHSTVSVLAGTHLTGGGDITADRTLNVDETGIDVTNLDGSAGTSGQFLQTDGSNLSFVEVSSFSGSYNDLTDVPELPEGVSLNEYRNWQNEIVSAIAENNFEVGLNQIGYPDGFFDVFSNNSKISSTTNTSVITGTNGKAILSPDSLNGDTEGNNATSEDQAVSSYEINADASNNIIVKEVNIQANTDTDDYTVSIIKSGNVIASKTVGGSFTPTASFSLSDYSEIIFSESFSVKVENESGNAELDVENSDSFSGNKFSYSNQTVGSTNTLGGDSSLVVEGVNYATSGSLQSTTTDLGYQSSKVTLTADYALNGQSIDSIEVYNGADNLLASYSESEIGQTKSISTPRTDYYAQINLSGDSSDTPEVNKYEIGLDDGT